MTIEIPTVKRIRLKIDKPKPLEFVREHEEDNQDIAGNFARKLTESQVELDAESQKLLNDNFLDLLA